MLLATLPWFFSSLNIFATIMNIRKAPISYLLWTICNIFWLIFDLFVIHVYAKAVIDFANLIISTSGFIIWQKSSKKKRKVKNYL